MERSKQGVSIWWKDAPDWAQWLAKDVNEHWWFYENKPIKSNYGYFSLDGRYTWVKGARIGYYAGAYRGWEFTLEQRPKQ